MKIRKKVVILVSVLLIASMLLGTAALAKGEKGNPFQQIWTAIFGIQDDVEDLQNQIDEIEIEIGAIRYVIEGTFDTTEEGDIVELNNIGDEYHWKRITVAQLTFSDMPLVKTYVKPNDNLPSSPHDMWRDAGEGLGSLPTAYTVYDEQSVLIFFKRIRTDGTEDYYMNGDYKIVVIK